MMRLGTHLALLNQSSEHSPPRITSNVKTTLKILTLFKELQESTSKQDRPATSYRKKKVDKKSLPEDFESYEDPATQVIDFREEITIVCPVLLVDGYNLCGAWPKLKKYFAKGDLMFAREKLIDELITYSAAKGLKTVVVFDARKSGLQSSRESRGGSGPSRNFTIQAVLSFLTACSVDIVYHADGHADTWIEREVYLLRDDGCPKIRVVTSDNLHQDVASGAGAIVWSCKLFIREMNELKKEIEQLTESDRPYSMQGKLLEHNLAPDVFTSLQALKHRLKCEERAASLQR